MNNLSTIIPVYNEKEAIKETVGFFKEMIKLYQSIEVIFIDDGSSDETPQYLKTIKSENIIVYSHQENQGYGAAIKTGINLSSYDNIAITDADGSYPNEKIPELFDIFINEKADMVIGARIGKIVHIGIIRRIGKFFLRKFAEYLSEKKIQDLNSGLRIIKKDTIQNVKKYLPNGFSFTTTLTLSLLAGRNKILYVPINYYKRKGKSKIRPIKDTLNFIQLILRTVMFFNPLKVFLPLSGLFIFLSLSTLLITSILGEVMDITTILLFITGLHFLAIGLLADLIDKRLK